jgi:hypothetical protein
MEDTMTFKDIMKYIESEFKVINLTPCEVCGGDYFADDLQATMINGSPYDICNCICSDCGYEKTFEFNAPFIDRKALKNFKKNLN